MATYGVTPTGFVLKRQQDIITEMNADFQAAFGADLDVSPDTPNGQFVGIVSNPLAELWQLAQNVYGCQDPNQAAGISLDNVAVLNFLKRNGNTFSTVTVTFTGDPLLPIAATNFIASTSPGGNQFTLVEDVTLDSFGTADAQMIATLPGPVAAPANTLTVISTPRTGLVSINNAADAAFGALVETDPQFRIRRNNATTIAAQNMADAIYANVSIVPGVTALDVLINETNVTDGNGLVPHSVAVVVEGGLDSAIAQAIFIKKASGIPTNGTTEYDVLNSRGQPVPIFFYRPTLQDIFIDITVVELLGFPSNGLQQIQQNLFNYLTGVLTGGIVPFSVGQNVLLSLFYTAINMTPGQSVPQGNILAGIGSASGTTDITIAFNELSAFDIDNISVHT